MDDKTIKNEENKYLGLYEAVDAICKRKKINIVSIDKLNKYYGNDYSIENIADLSGFAVRQINLELFWCFKDFDDIIIFDKNKKTAFSCIKGFFGYHTYDSKNKRSRLLSLLNLNKYEKIAYVIYKPLKSEKVSKKELIKFALSEIRKSDILYFIIFTVLNLLFSYLIIKLNQKVFGIYIYNNNLEIVKQALIIFIVLAISSFSFKIVETISSFRIEQIPMISIMCAIYDRIFKLPLDIYNENKKADLMERATNLELALETSVKCILTTVMGIVMSIVYFIVMMRYSIILSFLVVCSLLIVSIVSIVFAKKKLKIDISSLKKKNGLIAKMYQYLSAISRIRISGAEEIVVDEYNDLFTSFSNERKESLVLSAKNVNIISFLNAFSIVLIYIMISGFNIELNSGTFMAFMSVMGLFSSSMMLIVNCYIDYMAIVPLFERAEIIMNTKPEYYEDKECIKVKGNIKISHLTYSINNRKIINDVSLEIKEGESVGVVGKTASGKTTFVKLLLGLLNAENGDILYDGVSINNLNISELRKQMGVVLQNSQLLNGSILENVAINNAKESPYAVHDVIEQVGLGEEVDKMPLNVFTIVSEGSGNISSGQKQRLLIARAIMNKPKVLILDEATSYLDNLTQSKVMDTINKINATKIIVAHRISTISHCDKIVVFDEGNIVEVGDYESLINKKGMFYKLANNQLEKGEINEY